MATRRSSNQPTTAEAEPRPRSGKGSTGSFKSSVLDHRFGKGDPLTVGVEEEYMLLDGTTFDLQNKIETVLQAVQGSPLEDQVHPELMESTVEVASKVCRDMDDARRELSTLRRGLAEAVGPLGLRLGAAGTHPFALAEDQRITSRDRYRYIVEQLQYVARRELVFGMHVHVGVPSPELCMSVMEGVLVELPVLLALSSNSPFWRGKPSGLASTRQAVFAGFPRSGLPPRFGSYEDYAETVGWMETTHVIGDYTHLWWDVRPHPRLGTIELRVPDCQFDIEYTLALVAYVQALVAEILDECQKGNAPVAYHRALVAENKWLAARYGVDAQMMDLAGGRRVKLPASQLARRRLRQLAPYARELGCYDALQGIERILETGTGAARQLRVYNANQDLVEVMGELASVTELATTS
jgi:carboxylate-amine ligase